MGVIYVARSANFSKWASEVGITKHVFKIGYAADDPTPLIEAGWGGETDWALAGQREADGVSEDEALKRIVQRMPLGRMPEPEEIAYIVVFAASERARLLTGAILSADGATTPTVV